MSLMRRFWTSLASVGVRQDFFEKRLFVHPSTDWLISLVTEHQDFATPVETVGHAGLFTVPAEL